MPGHGVRGCGSLYIEQREERLFIKLKYFMAITYTLCKENCKTGIDRMSIDILLGKVTLVGNQLTPLWRSQRFIVQHRRQAYC